MQLGFNRLQAEVYVALLSLGQATGKALSQHSKVARQEVYRILKELQEKGLVEKIIVMPTKFKALPIEDCLRTLIERKKKKFLKQRKKQRSCSNSSQRTTQTIQTQFKKNPISFWSLKRKPISARSQTQLRISKQVAT